METLDIILLILAIFVFAALMWCVLENSKDSGRSQLLSDFTNKKIYFVLIEFEDETSEWITSDKLKDYTVKFTIKKEIRS